MSYTNRDSLTSHSLILMPFVSCFFFDDLCHYFNYCTIEAVIVSMELVEKLDPSTSFIILTMSFSIHIFHVEKLSFYV